MSQYSNVESAPLEHAQPQGQQREQGQREQGQREQGQGPTPDEERRVAHWRAWLISAFKPYFWVEQVDRQTLIVKRKLFTEWGAALGGVPEATLRAWFDRGIPPGDQYVLLLARHLGVLPQAVMYHAGRIGLDDLALWIGPQPLDLLEEEEYAQSVAALTYIPDEREREWARRRLEQSIQHTRALKALIRPSTHEEWLELRDELRSPAGQTRLRAQMAGPATTEELDNLYPQQAPTSWYLPAEFTGEARVTVKPRPYRRRATPTPTPTPTPTQPSTSEEAPLPPRASERPERPARPERHQRIGRAAARSHAHTDRAAR